MSRASGARAAGSTVPLPAPSLRPSPCLGSLSRLRRCAQEGGGPGSVKARASAAPFEKRLKRRPNPGGCTSLRPRPPASLRGTRRASGSDIAPRPGAKGRQPRPTDVNGTTAPGAPSRSRVQRTSTRSGSGERTGSDTHRLQFSLCGLALGLSPGGPTPDEARNLCEGPAEHWRVRTGVWSPTQTCSPPARDSDSL